MGKHNFILNNYTIEISEERASYNTIRVKYENLAEELSDEFYEIYTRENHNIENVSRNAYEQGCRVINKAVLEAVQDIIGKGIYEVDQSTFIQDYYNQYFDWEEYYDQVNNKYLDIVLTEEQKDEYRTVRRQNRGKWQGGGFGLDGAIKGVATAGAMNLATNAVHGVFNLGAKMISSAMANSEKSKLYKDKETVVTLYNGIYNNVHNIHLALIDVFEKYSKERYYAVTEEDSKKAEAMYNNIEMVPDKMKVIKDIIELNPYFTDVYSYVLRHKLNENGEISKIAKYFNLDLSKEINYLIGEVFNNESKSTEEEALKIKEKIRNLMEIYDLEESNWMPEIDKILNDIDIQKRTFKNYLYDTREDCSSAKKQDSELERMCKNVSTIDYSAVLDLINDISNQTWIGNVVDEYLIRLKEVKVVKERESLEKKIEYINRKSRKELLAIADEIQELQYDETLIKEYINKVRNAIDLLEIEELEKFCLGIDDMNRAKLFELSDSIQNTDFTKKNKDKYLNKVKKQICSIEDKLLQEKCAGIHDLSEDKARSLKTEVESLNFDAGVTEKYNKLIDDKIESIWKTEDGEIFDNLLMETDVNDVESIARSIELVKSNGRTADSQRYIKALGSFNYKNIKKAIKYRKYKEKGFLKSFWFELVGVVVFYVIYMLGEGTSSEDILAFAAGIITLYAAIKVVSIIGSKKLWNTMTINNKVIHPSLQSMGKK